MQSDTRRDRPAGSRLGLVIGLLAEALRAASGPGRTPTVLDCGGGSGAYAVPLAAAGADVWVLDISADALATLQRRADEAGVSERVHAVAGDVEAFAELAGTDQLAEHFDAVLAHGILDAVDEVEPVFAAMAERVRPGGLLSVLVGNPVASVLARALGGEPVLALAELRRLDDADRHDGPGGVTQLAVRAGLTVESRHGIGMFSDLVTGSAAESAGGREALAALDAEAAARTPFAELAGRIHLLLRRPVTSSGAPVTRTESVRGA